MTGNTNNIYEESEDFAIKIIFFCEKLDHLKHYAISKQLIRSGTSIGANVAEAKYAISNKEFISKLSIALKETNETLLV